MKVEVDQKKCLGCATCVSLAPNTFQLNEDGLSQVKDSKGDPENTILEAAKTCPAQAISVYDDQGKKIWPK